MIDRTSYVLELSDGTLSEHYWNDDETAINWAEYHLAGMYDVPEVVIGDEWYFIGRNDDGDAMERLLFFLSEEDAENDNGAKSIASLTVVRENV